MQSPGRNSQKVADAFNSNWIDRFAPDWLKPYARLARWDRPMPLWLLFWPCAFALGLNMIAEPGRGLDWWALLLFLVGSATMRGAGCTFNDIVDTDIDMKVARTRSRPIPAGQVTKKQAAVFLLLQLAVGLVILLQFNGFTVLLGVASLALVAIYPFMKRITWWPQVFLGLAFSWGALLGWAAETGGLSLPPVVLYLGCILWTIGYDTIYALQDIEDDALIGVKSTARLFGRRARAIIALFYAGAVLAWAAAAFMVGAGLVFVFGLAAVIAMLAWQVLTLHAKEPGNPLTRFRANQWVGLTLTLTLLLEAVL